MIAFLPRRGVAVLAALAFTLSLGEMVLASVCPPGAEMVVIMDYEEALDRVASTETEASDVSHLDPHGHAPGAANSEDAQHEGMPCCVGVGVSSSEGSEPIPCPFMPLGAAGSCQAIPFAAPAQLDLSLSFEVSGVLHGPSDARDFLFASPLFQPPRA